MNGNDGGSRTITIVSSCLSVTIIILSIIIGVLLFKLKRNGSSCAAKDNSSVSKPNELQPETPRNQGGRQIQTQYTEGPSREQDIGPALHYSRVDPEHELADYVNGENTYAEFHEHPCNGNAATKIDQQEAARSDRDTVYMNMSRGQCDNVYQNKPVSSGPSTLSVGNIYSN